VPLLGTLLPCSLGCLLRTFLPSHGQTAPYCLSSGPNRSGDGGGLLTSCRLSTRNPGARMDQALHLSELVISPVQIISGLALREVSRQCLAGQKGALAVAWLGSPLLSRPVFDRLFKHPYVFIGIRQHALSAIRDDRCPANLDSIHDVHRAID
jgi:hypothetical protein